MKKNNVKFRNRMKWLSALVVALVMLQVGCMAHPLIGVLMFVGSATMPMWFKHVAGYEMGILGEGAVVTEPTAEEKLFKKIQDELAAYKTREKLVTEERLKHIDTFLKQYEGEAGEVGKKLTDTLVQLRADFNALKEKGQPSLKDLSLVKAIGKCINENKEKFAALKKGDIKNFNIDIVYKGSQVPTDIADRDDYAQFLPGTNRKPVRSVFIRNLFRTIPTSREYVRYREENVVTRDAKIVVACASSTHNTKKSWVNRTVQIAKVRDLVDICIDMMDDYDFVEAEIRQLIEESLKLKTDAEMFNGTDDILSIDSIASEFDAANVLAPYTASFTFPNIAELTAAMKAQIYTFGAENKWDADTILMNHNDWTKFMHKKDEQGNYLLPNFVLTNGGMLNGMQIVTNPLVSPNTLYVFDSKQGAVLDRQMMTVELSYENATNFETETVTVKAYERVQFLVKQIDQDAFMKCSDITAALTAIAEA